MTQLVGPTWGTVTNPAFFLTSWQAPTVGANLLEAIFEHEINIAGTNSVFVARLYENATATFVGATQVGAQAVLDATVTEAHFSWDAGLVTPGNLVAVFWANNTSPNTNGMYTSLYDDVGFSSSVNVNGCCHDPMLDEILAAVKQTFA